MFMGGGFRGEVVFSVGKWSVRSVHTVYSPDVNCNGNFLQLRTPRSGLQQSLERLEPLSLKVILRVRVRDTKRKILCFSVNKFQSDSVSCERSFWWMSSNFSWEILSSDSFLPRTSSVFDVKGIKVVHSRTTEMRQLN